MHYSYESNTVFIRDMELACIVGINAKERQEKTNMLLNIVLTVNSMHAKDTDDIRDTLNYSDVYKKIRALEETTDYQLIETLADHICQICFEEPLAKKVVVTLEKPGIHAGSKSAGIEVVATRDDQNTQHGNR